jgi:hypothetical protein
MVVFICKYINMCLVSIDHMLIAYIYPYTSPRLNDPTEKKNSQNETLKRIPTSYLEAS